VNRLRDPFQYQERDVADPELGATTVVQLNRQRTIASARGAYTRLATTTTAVEPARDLYGELHGLGAGTRRRESDATLEALPSDWGTTLGVELTAWRAPGEAGRTRAASLFAKWSKGLAAFDELAAPTSFDAELRTFAKASELVLGAGGSWDAARYHVVAATYLRRFIDADVNTRDRDDGWEYAANVRPAVKLHDHGVYAALDLGYEARFPKGLQPTTQAAADATIVSVAPMLTFHPDRHLGVVAPRAPPRLSRRAPERRRARALRPGRSAGAHLDTFPRRVRRVVVQLQLVPVRRTP
jgi:hypothetical protein